MKTTLFIILLSCAASLNAQETRFENIIIDNNASGHREIADVDGDSLNDIVAVNEDLKGGHKIVWYRYPSWEGNVIVDLDAFQDFQNYRACDMELADLNLDGYPDVLGRIGLDNDLDGSICWFEHPGNEDLSSRIIHSGPLKLTFESETEDIKWSCLWEVYPDYATMTLQKKGTRNYWLLYEGTPAGKLDMDRDYWVQSNGFGRKPDENPGTYLEEVPVHLTIGFAESKDYNAIKNIIRAAIYEPVIETGKIHKMIQ